MCSIDFDSWDAMVQRHPRAKRDYVCYECRRVIPQGDRYVYTVGFSIDGIDRYRTHEVCEELRDFIQSVVCGGVGAVLFGGLDEEVEEASEYLHQTTIDFNAWDDAELEPPDPIKEVWTWIKSSYPMKSEASV